MDNNSIMLLIGFIGSMIAIITVIVKLNGTITELNTTMRVLSEQMKSSQKDRQRIHTQLNDHETRITVLEQKKN